MKRDVAYYQKTKPLKIFLSYYRPHIHLFVLDMVCALIICLIDLAFPYISRSALKTLLPQQEYRVFFLIIAFFAVAYIGKGLLYFVVSYWGHLFGVRVEADLRRDLYAHMESLSFSFFDQNRTGALMSRVTNDLFEITELAHHGPEDLFISTVTLVGAFCIMCSIEWRLAVITFAIVPFFILFTVYQRRKMRQANLKLKAQTAEINAAIESGISGMRTAKAFQNEETEKEKFGAMNQLFVQAKTVYYKTMATFQGGMEFSLSIMPVLVIGAGGYFIMKGVVSQADLVAFTLYVTTFTTPVKKLVNFVEQFMQGSAGFTRFLELMRLEPEIQDAPDAKDLGQVKGEVEFDHVSFRYNDKDEVLRNINLTIHAGEKFAFVGPSGGGKTTICQLIPRFYDVSEGSVEVDGLDVREYPVEALRERIGMVLQKNVLFSGTIRENLLWGDKNATEEQMVRAAKDAQAHDFIMSLPNGYDTMLEQGGVNVSGGQKQRLCIARAMLRHPSILILDDSTSAVDSATEAEIRRSFHENLKDTTVIIIAQRISSVRYADKIVILEDDHIAAEGTHDELLASSPIYQEIYASQQEGGLSNG